MTLAQITRAQEICEGNNATDIKLTEHENPGRPPMVEVEFTSDGERRSYMIDEYGEDDA